MGILTTCIGAYPKPDYINIANWSESEPIAAGDREMRGFTCVSGDAVDVSARLLDRASGSISLTVL